ncbi:MAG: CPBP family intramembrane metalloprotease, partial [Hyphomicrobiaceae bacterium]|nr:CPBP family intramembrane metalloprotease [Hyphomicrobiaceae bacterium]
MTVGGRVTNTYEYKPARFFLMVYAGSWVPWFFGVYAGSRGQEAFASLLSLVGLLAPIGVALTLVLTSGNRPLKSDFKDRIINVRRIRPIYILLAVALPFAVVCLSIWLSLLVGQSSDQFAFSGGVNLPAMIILALVLAPIMEEMGWHGYGVDGLRAGSGMLKTTLLFGVLWSAWHAPLFLISGTYQNGLVEMGNPVFVVNFFVSVIPAAIIANWLYYKNNRSITAAVLLHSMLNAAAVLLNAGQVAKCIATLLYAGVAVSIIAIDRAAFTQGPRNFLPARE